MERVHILNRVDTVDNLLVVEVLRERKLTKDTVDFFILVKPVHKRVELLLRCFGRESIFYAVKAALLTGALLVPYIYLRSGVVADNNYRKPGSYSLSLECFTFCFNLFLNRL